MPKLKRPTKISINYKNPEQPSPETIMRVVALLFRRSFPRAQISTIADLTLSDTEVSCERNEPLTLKPGQ